MHGEPSDLAAFDKRVCSCRECSEWGSPVIDWRKRRHPKNAPSVAWRGQWWWQRADGYYAAWDRNKKRPIQLHRKIWEAHRGSIPESFHLHHIDHDKTNNQIDNLEPMHPSDHMAHHRIDHIKAPRPEAKTIDCHQCGQPFVVEKLPSRKKFCSHACVLESRRKRRTSAAKPSPVCVCRRCGADFVALRKDAKFCSRRCSSASQDRSAYQQAYYRAHPEKFDGSERQARRAEVRSIPKKCIGCGQTFVPKRRKNEQYCAKSCQDRTRSRRYRNRQKRKTRSDQ